MAHLARKGNGDVGVNLPMPRWEDDRLAWCIWYLQTNPHVYVAYRQLADDYRKDDPKRVCSSDLFFSVLRYMSVVRAWGDDYSLNNNAKAIFARLYQLERHDAQFDNRKSWIDEIDELGWTTLIEVFAPISEGRVALLSLPELEFDDLFEGLLTPA